MYANLEAQQYPVEKWLVARPIDTARKSGA